MVFSLDIPYIIWGLLALALLLSIVWVVWYNRRSMRLLKFIKYDERTRRYLHPDDLPAVSVIVFANDDETWLNKYLPTMMRQQYPAAFEVIVVDDASVDGTKDLIGEMMAYYDHLKIVTVPDQTRSLSRKKLAIMLGIKAAQHDVILTTNANCEVHSDRWLMAMMRNFGPGIDVVLGYSHFDYQSDNRFGKSYRIFDEMTTSMQWLLSAINGKPYRGTSDNLAYRKEVFYQNKGFSNSLEMKWGDDDIFVSEIANAKNTRVELLPASFMTSHYDDLPHAFSILKSRRDFTSNHVKYKSQFFKQAFMSLLYWLRLAALVAAVVMAYTNIAVIVMAAIIFVLSWLPLMLITFRNCYLLRLPFLFFSTPLFILVRPVVNIAYWIKGLFGRKNNYTTII
ncbi:MAG: glycosyltransferase [Muribaculaceae bacterium]|nr:glycosyltransferase [Muribaculaceae bacterium]MBR6490341.1 glycosyltransferase [Muribaculaceae bacterium]